MQIERKQKAYFMVLKHFLRMILTAGILLFSIACESDDSDKTPPTHFVGELNVNGLDRTYMVNVPSTTSAGEKLPLVFMFHGTGGNASQAERDYGWTEKSSEENFIVVYPEGVAGDGRFGVRTWNAGRCCHYAMENNIDDVKFVNELLTHMIENYPVDETKVYAAGMSNGAMLVYRLACELPGKFAAFASVSGTMMLDEPCTAAHTPPFLQIHSTTDTKIPFAGGKGLGGYNFAPVDSAINVIKAINECTNWTVSEHPGYSHHQASDCNTAVPLEMYLLSDGGHSWPGGRKSTARSDTPCEAINATEVIWRFFNEHQR
jgi:polyhydroxybutyrate depolymerase